MNRLLKTVAVAALLSAIVPATAGANDNAAGAPEVVSVEKIWDQGEHNAFTDLVRFNDTWYCTFREADNHVGTDGLIQIIRSADGASWESCGLLEETGVDLRDPKITVTPDNRLMVNMGGSIYEGDTLVNRRPRVSFSSDGQSWSAPKKICSDGDWLWRVTWHEGQAWGVSYEARTGEERPWMLRLYVSDNGEDYRIRTIMEVPESPNETTLRFTPGGTMIALVRREGGDKGAYIGVSGAPYVDWEWNNTGVRLGGPNFLQLPGGRWVAAGRSYPEGAKTALYEMNMISLKAPGGQNLVAAAALELLATLPSGGDTSYPGLVWHDDLLWVSYYASHEGKTSIYLAKVRFGGGGVTGDP